MENNTEKSNNNMTNDEESETEEEILVYAEFANSVNIEKYNSIHILGINKKNPIIQLNDTFFTGSYENPLGTYMFFEDDLTPHSTDPVFDRLPERNVKYLCKTRKFMKMEHGYITPKDAADENTQNQTQQTHDEIKPINFKTLQEALDKFKQDWASNESTTSVK